MSAKSTVRNKDESVSWMQKAFGYSPEYANAVWNNAMQNAEGPTSTIQQWGLDDANDRLGGSLPPSNPFMEGGIMGSESGSGSGDQGIADQFASLYANMMKYSPELQANYFKLASQYLPQYQTLAEQLRSRDRTANMSDVFAMTPKFQQLEKMTQGNRVYDMRKMLGDQIYGDLAMGSQLDPESRRLAEQYSRSADLSRGVGMGSGSANREAVAKALSGNALKQQRQQSAMQFGQFEQGQRYDPFASTMGMPNSAMSAAYGSFEQPFNQMTNLNASALQAQNMSNQQNQFQQSMAQQAANQANMMNMLQQQIAAGAYK